MQTPTCSGRGALGSDQQARRQEARRRRVDAADREYARGAPPQDNNRDEVDYQASSSPFVNVFPGSFTKGMPHNAGGELAPCPPPATGGPPPLAYCQLLDALASENSDDFDKICRGVDGPGRQGRRFENPQAGLAYSIQGADSHALALKPAPKVWSDHTAAEMVELYWMALARDVPFEAYDTDPLIKEAAADLSANWSKYFGPSATHPWAPAVAPQAFTAAGVLDPKLLFRGNTPCDYNGPYMSQFLLRDIPYGAQVISARCRTLLPNDYMTSWQNWLDVQNGNDFSQSNCDPVLRLPRNGRDMSQYVHADTVWQAFMNAAILMLSPRDPVPRCEPASGLGVPFAAGLPYVNPCAPAAEEGVGKSPNQVGFGTFGKRHLETLLLQAAQLAVQAVWYQKWSVHRRLRPEAYGGWVHLAKVAAGGKYAPVIPRDLINSPVLEKIADNNRAANKNLTGDGPDGRPNNSATYLLPQVFAEGSPLHPAYGSGHSTVAGACGAILKAFFREDWLVPNPVAPDAAGLTVLAYRGPDADKLTVRNEVDKLVSNIGISRLFAGVHWRSDHTQSIKLGEEVAIRLLQSQACTFNEPYEFNFHRYDGTPVKISAATECGGDPPGVTPLPPNDPDNGC